MPCKAPDGDKMDGCPLQIALSPQRPQCPVIGKWARRVRCRKRWMHRLVKQGSQQLSRSRRDGLAVSHGMALLERRAWTKQVDDDGRRASAEAPQAQERNGRRRL